jgi:hypothetical protein
MSCHRENITWQSRDGKWNIGFYDYFPTGDSSDPEWDYEWDVEYYDHFHWVSTGHPDEDSAYRSWKGANPGGTIILPFNEETAAECDQLDTLAKNVRKL